MVQLRAQVPGKLGESIAHCLEERRTLLEEPRKDAEVAGEGVLASEPLSPLPAGLQSLLAETTTKLPALR